MTLPDGRTEGVGGAAAAGVDSGPPGGSAEARLLGAAGASWPPINDSLLGLGADGSYTSPESELCALTTASTPLEGHDPHCPASWDLILCWPPTRPGALAVQQCLEELNGIKYDPTGNASRWCFPNGTWSRTNYSLCKDVVVSGPELEAAEAGAVEFVTMVYQVGYGLSLVALAFAVLIFVSFKDLHCLRNSIHTNLMFAYIMADLTWILNNSVQTSHIDSDHCLLLLVLYHYFHLTTFTWMFVEGLYLYILVVETFTRENVRLRCYVLIGWGSPMVFVSLWAVARCLSPPPTLGWQVDYCSWMLAHWSDWLFQAPALVVLGINSVFLIVIMWVLITKLRSATSLETQQSRKATKALLVLIPLLGMTYVLTIAAPPAEATGSAVYAAVRAFLLSTQGMSVALLYCFLNAEVRRALHHRWHRWRESRDLAARPCPACAKDWSPRSRTESIRLYCPPVTATGSKRESTASQSTTTTLLGVHQVHQGHHLNLNVEHTV